MSSNSLFIYYFSLNILNIKKYFNKAKIGINYAL